MKDREKGLSYIHPDAKIHDNVFIDQLCTVGMGVTIEKDVYISRGTIIYGKTIIKQGTYLGENCIIGHPERERLKIIVQNKLIKVKSIGPIISIGENCIIRSGTIIYSDVYIGSNCQTGHNVMIRENTKIGESSLIGTNTIIDGNVNIGRNTSIQTGVYIPLFSEIGNHVFMGPYSKLTNDKYMMRKEYKLKGPTIEDNVSIGANSVILPNIVLKEGTIIGAGSVVTKNTEKSDILVGNPAKLLKKIPNNRNF
jgi:acetyltransferase-like isoleucine patch superfamily enzyme